MKPDEVKQLEETILKAGISAFEKHYEMSDGEWVGHTPEYWYTCHIGEKIFKKFSMFYTSLESSMDEVRKCAKPKAGNPARRLKSGRTDITVWEYCETKGKYTAETIIEVKRGWSWAAKTMGEDIDRLRAALLQTGRIKDTFFVVMTDDADSKTETAKKKILRRQQKIKEAIEEHLSRKKHPIQVYESEKFSKHYKEDESQAAVLLYRLRYDGRKARKAN